MSLGPINLLKIWNRVAGIPIPKILIFLFIPFLSLSLTAEENYKFRLSGYDKMPIILEDSTKSIPLDESIFYLKSEKDFPSFEKLLESGEYEEIAMPKGRTPNFGYSESNFYLYFRIQDNRKIKDEMFLLLDYPVFDSLELTCYDSFGSISVLQRTGDHIPYDEWKVKYRKPGFFLDTDIRECILKGNSGSSIQFPLTLYSMIEFYEIVKNDSIVQSLYFGALICMVIYNILIGISIRSMIYFYYSGFLVSYGLFQGAFLGLNYIIFTNVLPIFLVDKSLAILIFINSICIILFFHNLLDIKNKLNRVERFGKILITINLLGLVSTLFFPYSSVVRLSTTLLFLSTLNVFSTSLYLSLKKDTMAIIYLSAWVVFLIGTISLIMLSLGIVERNFLSVYGTQIGSVIEFILLSIAMGHRLSLIQKKTAMDLHEIVGKQEVLLKEEKERVERQTELIQMVERERENAKNAYFQLEASQRKLVQSDKMITLGTMLAGVVHEINTPLGAIKASSEIISQNLDELTGEKSILQELSRDDWMEIFQLIRLADESPKSLSTKELRARTKKLRQYLEDRNIPEYERVAELILILGLGHNPDSLETILQNPKCNTLLMVAGELYGIKNKSSVIGVSANRVSKLVKSLKSYMHFEEEDKMVLSDLSSGIETVLAILHNKMKHGIEVIKEYETLSQVYCYPDELNQIWTNLIHNSIQAMNGEGTILIHLFREANSPEKVDIDKRDLEYHGSYVGISIEDTGPGIPVEIRSKIFEAFFTTKPVGEGSGLGLHIIGKILEKHRGALVLESMPGKTKFTILIPEKLS